jgi:CRP-like cAMP-binding protein
MDKKGIEFLSSTFLFQGIPMAQAEKLLMKTEGIDLACKKGECVNIDKAIAFVQSGECEVIREQSGHEHLVLNNLKKGDSFGILSVFTDEPYATAVVAKKESHILLLKREALIDLIEHSPALSMNVIRFLSGRVSFLTHKVATISGATVEEKCIAYLRDEYRAHGETIEFSVSKVARRLGAGRASLYRALSALDAEGIISHGDGSVKILRTDYFD